MAPDHSHTHMGHPAVLPTAPWLSRPRRPQGCRSNCTLVCWSNSPAIAPPCAAPPSPPPHPVDCAATRGLPHPDPLHPPSSNACKGLKDTSPHPRRRRGNTNTQDTYATPTLQQPAPLPHRLAPCHAAVQPDTLVEGSHPSHLLQHREASDHTIPRIPCRCRACLWTVILPLHTMVH